MYRFTLPNIEKEEDERVVILQNSTARFQNKYQNFDETKI